MVNKKLFLLLTLSCCVYSLFAQLSFPDGKNLNLDMATSSAYVETEIHFHTGKYLITDYQFDMVTFSYLVDTNWFIYSCMNGMCMGGVADHGIFQKELGYNDTTGFIRFHVNTNGLTGSTIIKYIVSNISHPDSDNAMLTFNISYTNKLGVNSIKNGNAIPDIFPNPATDHFTIKQNDMITEWSITDMQGKRLYTSYPNKNKVEINTTELALKAGMYFIRTVSGERTEVRKISIQ